VEVLWNIKKFVSDTVSDLVGKVDGKARKPWITQEIFSKMNEQKSGRMLATKYGGTTIRD
jgi:hypothetical protein